MSLTTNATFTQKAFSEQAIEETMDAILGQLQSAQDVREMTEGEGHNGYLSLQELISNLKPVDLTYSAANIIVALGRLVEAGQVEAEENNIDTTFGLPE